MFSDSLASCAMDVVSFNSIEATNIFYWFWIEFKEFEILSIFGNSSVGVWNRFPFNNVLTAFLNSMPWSLCREASRTFWFFPGQHICKVSRILMGMLFQHIFIAIHCILETKNSSKVFEPQYKYIRLTVNRKLQQNRWKRAIRFPATRELFQTRLMAQKLHGCLCWWKFHFKTV